MERKETILQIPQSVGEFGEGNGLPSKEVTIGPKAVDCIFIGYTLNSSAHRFVVHKSEISTITVGTTIESRNAVFLEKYISLQRQRRGHNQL